MQEFANKQVEAVNTVDTRSSTRSQGQDGLTETNKQRETHSYHCENCLKEALHENIPSMFIFKTVFSVIACK
ncbi:hypothetical protein GOODEAATRI_006825 [Goodea atripinnis]|uniref:Uncharacterized protein n=2 Tax=Goodeidae TaxID=28758 RepID=A0ABV0PBZ6_9TELE